LLFAYFGVRTFFFGVIDLRLRRWRSWSAFFLPFLPVPPFPPLLPFLPWSLLRMILVPEKLCVRSRVDEDSAVSHLDDLRRQALDEVPIMRHENQRSAVVDERVEQDFLRVEVEVVGGLVEEQRVRGAEKHPGDGESRALAARQHADFLVDVVAGKQKAAEDVADGWHHVVRRSRRE